MAELEEANAQLLAELNAAQSRLAEVELHEQNLTSNYEGLCTDFDDLHTSHDVVVKEKANLEKTKHEKEQQFWKSLRKKLAELPVDMEVTVTALGAMHEFSLCQHYCHWVFGVLSDGGPSCIHCLFWMQWEYYQLCSDWCFQDACRVECGHLPELKKMALSCDDSLLHDVPDNVGWIEKKLVKN
jgi:hypothetical protein